MKEFLNELARLWWVEVGTDLTNPLSEQSIDGLRKILKEEYNFDDEVIEYIIESAVKTPTKELPQVVQTTPARTVTKSVDNATPIVEYVVLTALLYKITDLRYLPVVLSHPIYFK